MDFKTILEFIKELSPLIIAIGVLIFTNRHNKRMLSAQKTVETIYTVKEEKRIHQKVVYSSLVNILFQVQKLHIDLSGRCVDYACIPKAVETFKKSLDVTQQTIAENQIYLSASLMNELYGFYKLIGELLIELNTLQEEKKFHLAIACVHIRATQLAMATLYFSDEAQRKKTKWYQKKKNIEFEYTDEYFSKHRNFIDCCGYFPDTKIMQEYLQRAPEQKNIADMLQGFHEKDVKDSKLKIA